MSDGPNCCSLGSTVAPRLVASAATAWMQSRFQLARRDRDRQPHRSPPVQARSCNKNPRNPRHRTHLDQHERLRSWRCNLCHRASRSRKRRAGRNVARSMEVVYTRTVAGCATYGGSCHGRWSRRGIGIPLYHFTGGRRSSPKSFSAIRGGRDALVHACGRCHPRDDLSGHGSRQAVSRRCGCDVLRRRAPFGTSQPRIIAEVHRILP